jgi:hypothetical protein
LPLVKFFFITLKSDIWSRDSCICHTKLLKGWVYSALLLDFFRVSHIRFFQLFAMKRIDRIKVLFREYSLWFVNNHIKIFASIRFNSHQNIRFGHKANVKDEIFASIRFNSLQNIRFGHKANLKDEIFASIRFKIFAFIHMCLDIKHWHAHAAWTWT